MPSAYTIQYAIPLCFARRMVRNGPHGVHYTCFRPLRYRAPTNEWECGACGGLSPQSSSSLADSTGERRADRREARALRRVWPRRSGATPSAQGGVRAST